MMAGGRPPKYDSVEELEKKIEEYFESGHEKRTIIVGSGKDKEAVEIPVYTITGLCLFLGFCDKSSFYYYEKKPEFSYSIKKARTKIESHYEAILQTGGGSGIIFALKNFGWEDKRTNEHTSKEDKPFTIILNGGNTNEKAE